MKSWLLPPKHMIQVISTIYNDHRKTSDFLFWTSKCCKAYSLSRLSHSIKKNAVTSRNTMHIFIERIGGMLKSVTSKISATYWKACVRLSALKNIQAKTVRVNVANICVNSRNDGNCLPFATISIFFLLFFDKSNGKK